MAHYEAWAAPQAEGREFRQTPARLEIEIAVGTLVGRFPALRLAMDNVE